MKIFGSVLITASIILFLLYVNSFFLHDRSLFVPPPESVTEQFVKMLESKRFSIAMKDLSQTSPYKTDVDSLKELNNKIEQKLGKYRVSGGKSHQISQNVALSNVSLRGKSQIWPVFLLINENGLWKIERLASR